MKRHDSDDLHEAATCMLQFSLRAAMSYDLINFTLKPEMYTKPVWLYSSARFAGKSAILDNWEIFDNKFWRANS